MSILDSKSVTQAEVEKVLFFAAIYTLAFYAAFQVTSL